MVVVKNYVNLECHGKVEFFKQEVKIGFKVIQDCLIVLSVYFIWTLSATKTFFLLRSTFLIVITDRIHFDGFLTNRTFISLVGLNMVVKCFLANANFVTNVTIHVFYSMNYPMEP